MDRTHSVNHWRKNGKENLENRRWRKGTPKLRRDLITAGVNSRKRQKIERDGGES